MSGMEEVGREREEEKDPSPTATISVALIGAGIFARDAHVPMLRMRQNEIKLRYVWSRTEASSVSLVSLSISPWSPSTVALWGEEGMERAMRDDTLDACIVALPIQNQPDVVKQCLRAGKHVLQEKPIATTFAHGSSLLQWYKDTFLSPSLSPALSPSPSIPPIWAVSENFRFERVFDKAGEVVAGRYECDVCRETEIETEVARSPSSLSTSSLSLPSTLPPLGAMRLVHMDVQVCMREGANKYFGSEWRRRGDELPGGFITDCGVHFIAALRQMTGRVASIQSVFGVSAHRDESLPSPDHMAAVVVFDNGCLGDISISYSSPENKMLWRVVLERGVVEVERTKNGDRMGYQMTVRFSHSPEVSSPSPSPLPSFSLFFPCCGMEESLGAFARDVIQMRRRREEESSLDKTAIIQTAHSSSYAHSSPPPAFCPPLPYRSSDPRSHPVQALVDLSIIETCLRPLSFSPCLPSISEAPQGQLQIGEGNKVGNNGNSAKVEQTL